MEAESHKNRSSQGPSQAGGEGRATVANAVCSCTACLRNFHNPLHSVVAVPDEAEPVVHLLAEDYRKYFEADAALARRFQPVAVEPPAPDAARAMLEVCVVS